MLSDPEVVMALTLRRLAKAVARRALPGAMYSGLRTYYKRRKVSRRPPNRYNAKSQDEAAHALAAACFEWAERRPGPVLVVGDRSAYRGAVIAAMERAGVDARVEVEVPPQAVEAHDLLPTACIALGVADSQTQFKLARSLLDHPVLSDVPMEYVAVPRVENAPLQSWDRYVNGDFVSPLLTRTGSALFEIYREALRRFQMKMDIRDFLDLCHLIWSVHSRGIPGDLAEFGSYKGHSGYLTSRVLEYFESDKTLFMFDSFADFPEEEVGIDGFWSGTHEVDFERVKERFAGRSNVRFVQGEFTETLPGVDTGPLALAFVDCDSYRATRYLLPEVWERRLSPGGIVALEDYGHAALLGNRIAAHEFFDERRDAYTYFSQFSGFLAGVKLPGPSPRGGRRADAPT